jgi:hypothetical protein
VNVTVPVGLPLPGATTFTVAVRVTDRPNTAGFANDASSVVVAASVAALRALGGLECSAILR